MFTGLTILLCLKVMAIIENLQLEEPVSKCSILFEIKESENFNRRNILNISRIEI